MKLIVDIETDNLEVSQVNNIWLVVTKDIETGTIKSFRDAEEAVDYCASATHLIGHNIIGYDFPVLDSRYHGKLDTSKVLDTLVLSRLLKYRLDDDQGHSLEAWGNRFGLPKLSSPDFSKYSDEMLTYCLRDVEINNRLYDYLKQHMDSPDWYQAIRTEMQMAWICEDMHNNGFKYNKAKADILKQELQERLNELDKQIKVPPHLVRGREYTPRATKFGTISRSSVPRAWRDLSTLSVDCGFCTFTYEDFNFNSYPQLTSLLNKAGWRPTEKTKTGNGYKINEHNLATLPETAPEGTRKLVERLMLAARVRTLNEWEAAYRTDTGRIHGQFAHIGTWPGRMSHRSPNLGNIATKKSIKYKGDALRQLALYYGEHMRRLWICPDDTWLVGTDMEAAHVRLFAHYIDDKEFTKAVVSGDKKLGTDVHSLGAGIFKHLGCDRDLHKTFIFSFFNGAGAGKVSEIFGCSMGDAQKALELYRARYPGLAKLQQELIPGYARQGWFPGLDGRKVYYGEEHGMFAGMLQSGEAIVMKMANILWRKELNNAGIQFKQVNLVHDEYVTEIRGDQSLAESVGRLQSAAIRRVGEELLLKCPLAGEYKVGRDWLEVH